MEPRVSIITLGVADLARSRAFYEALGFHGQEVEQTAFYQLGGLALVLWGRANVADDAAVPDDGSTFSGIVLAHNVTSREEVDSIVDTAQRAGAEVTKPPSETFYGGYAGFFRDPDGHTWEIAHNPGFTINADGTLTLPDFGNAS